MTQTADLKMHQFESHSGKETIAVGHRIAELLVPPKFLILRGDLGAGKTTLVKGIAEALDAADPDEVTSPTFTLIHEYEGEYREHGKLVLPPNAELPPPGGSASADPAWPVNQEILRKKALKEEGKKSIAGVGDARLRYTHGFPANEPVTIRAVDPDGQAVKCETNCGSSSSVLSNLNPLKWVGMGGKSDAALGGEPDREWLTDPPKGFRAPVEPVQGSAKN